MNIKILSNSSGGTQAFFFLFFAFIGFILAALSGGVVALILGNNDSITFYRLSQFIQAVCLFILPCLIFVYLLSEKPASYLQIDKKPPLIFTLLSILLIITTMPLIEYTGWLNEQIPFPDKIIQLIKSMEGEAERIVNLFLSDNSFSGIFLNFFIIALVAAIGEELFFRGCLQQIIGKIITNQHLSIWITAALFSAIHFEFLGFIPRLLLGSILGYLYIWSRSLWVPIIVHFINNALVVAYHYWIAGSYIDSVLENFKENNYYLIIFFSFVVSLFILLFLYKHKVSCKIIQNTQKQ